MTRISKLTRKMMILAFATVALIGSAAPVMAQTGTMASVNVKTSTDSVPEPFAGGARFDTSRFPEERRTMTSVSFQQKFPCLGTDFEVEAPSTGYPRAGESIPPEGVRYKYNCIAWALRIVNHPVWEGDTMQDFDRLFGEHGYIRQEWLDKRVDGEVEKIALYGNFKADGKFQATHASRQLTDGTWTSKIGGMAQIRHRTPESLSGPSYGTPVAIYVKVKTTESTMAVK